MIERFGSRALTIPMPAGKVRSLNLATATGIVLYEALRQLHGW
jgi:tRNA (cytidine/uridine-2'-O-)-methyltransferase